MSREDDEIQVLGQKPTSRKKIGWLWLFVIAFALVGTAGYLVWQKIFPNNQKPETLSAAQIQVIEYSDTTRNCRLEILTDTINDVPLTIFSLTEAYALLSIGLPDTTDQKIILALPAADIRKDKLNILGDFIINGQRMGTGKRKAGCVVLNKGAIWLGIDESDESCRYCDQHQASMFRQYPLVIKGEVYANQLKGKSLRRAIAMQQHDKKVYIVSSNQRESLHDFSEALADLGFYNAIYLPGGDSFSFYRINRQLHYLGQSMEYIYPNSSFVLFLQ